MTTQLLMQILQIEELDNYEVDQGENNNIADEGEATQPTASENAANEV